MFYVISHLPNHTDIVSEVEEYNDALALYQEYVSDGATVPDEEGIELMCEDGATLEYHSF